MDKITKIGVSAALGLGASLVGAYAPIFACVCIVIVFDVATGLIKSKVIGTPISSTQGTIGFWKKMALFMALFFGVFLDVFIPIMLGVVDLNLPFKLPIGTVVGCYIVINESISIIENINTAAPNSLPKWIKKLLKGAGETINNGGEDYANDQPQEPQKRRRSSK